MVNSPFFSIIIPTYNSEFFIKKCLDSVLLQTHGDYEILIVDGLSTDNTLQIATSFYDHRIVVVSEQDNGIYDAMNKGIRLAKGRWLYFLGSDDALFDENVLMDIFNFLGCSDYEMVYGNVHVLQENLIYDGAFTLDKLLTQKNICHQAIFYKHNIFEKVGTFNTNYKVLADYDFNIRCFKNDKLKIKYFDRTIAIYNIDGLSSGYSREIEPYLNELPHINAAVHNSLKNSLDYKIGNFVLAPFRYLKTKLFNN